MTFHGNDLASLLAAFGSSGSSSFAISRRIVSPTQSFSFIQSGMAWMNELQPRGA